MKKILVLHTGGTIAMKENMLTGGVSPDVANPLLDAEITIPKAWREHRPWELHGHGKPGIL